MISDFHYEPLRSPTDFRIIVLLPGQDNEPVRCQMRNVAHSRADEYSVLYEALSYVWGVPADKTSIECDSASIKVPSNLCSALRHLRWPDRPRILWADSLCINQEDAEEKSIQVQAMGPIYSSAERVIMWQGEETEQTQGSLSSLARLCELATAKEDSEEWQDFLEQVHHARSPGYLDREANFSQRQTKKIDWAAIVALLSGPYFSRRWIAQEIILANKAVMVCGHQTLDWARICAHPKALVRCMRVASHIILHFSGGQGNLKNFMYLASSSKANSSSNPQVLAEIESLYDALLVLSSSQCFDPRDKVFALLHISPDVDLTVDTEVAPDYTVSGAEILHRLAIWLVVRKRHTSYLSFAFQSPHQSGESRSDLPSWVPSNLDNVMAVQSLQYRITRNLNSWRSGNRNASPMKDGIELSQDRRTITVNGKIIDRVENRSSLIFCELVEQVTRGSQTSINVEVRDKFGTKGLLDLALAWWIKDSLSIQCRDGGHWGEFACSDRFAYYLSDVSMVISGTLQGPRSDRESLILRYMKYLSNLSQWSPSKDEQLGERHPDFQSVLTYLAGIASQHRLCRTSKGILGLIRGDVQPGDLVCALDGTRVPWVIRPSGSGHYVLIGECCLENLFRGECLELPGIPDQKISLC